MKHCRIQKGHLCETKTEEFVFCERNEEAGYFMYMTNLAGHGYQLLLIVFGKYIR